MLALMGRKSTGTAWEQGDSWRVQLTLNGKRWSGTIPARKDRRPITQAYADDFKARLLERWTAGDWDPWAPEEVATAPTQTVASYVEDWLGKQSYSTIHDDKRRVKRYLVGTRFGRTLMFEVRPRDVAAWLDELKARPAVRGGKLAARSVRNAYSVVQRAFARATVDEVFDVSPCDAVARAGLLPEIADKKPGDRVTWKYTREEVAALLRDARVPLDRRTLYGVLFLTGCRIGEAAALRWGDYDTAAQPLGRLTFARSVQPETRAIKSTKTGAIKLAPVVPELAAMLATWRADYVARHRREPPADALMLPNRRGRPRVASTTHKTLARDCVKLAIDDRGMQLHGARHTFVTLARSMGARGEILRWVTHAPPKAMLDQYTSPEWETLCQEVSKLRIAPDNAQ